MSGSLRKATQESPGDLNWEVESCRPAESIREQWSATAPTSVFRFYTFAVVRDLLTTTSYR